MVTELAPDPAVALDEAALELLDDDSDELELDDDPVDDLSPDEQPARPATTIAVPPTATSKLCFTTVLLLSVRSFKIRPSKAVWSATHQPRED
jgi:hypothetical protein